MLTPVHDLACYPKAEEECVDLAREVPYIYPDLECTEVEDEECVEVVEEIPVQVCTSEDPGRRARIVKASPPYRKGR